MDCAELKSEIMAFARAIKDEKRRHCSELFWLLAIAPCLRFDGNGD
jgi:hypothetical protein